jgi:GT2 family glycosyltransferase
MQPEVSVIIVHYNTPELTEACVRSVLAFTKSCSFEILIVDNASTVGDISFLAKEDQRVRYLPQSENLGFAKVNNAGYYEAKGEYILLLNSDTELLDDAISNGLSVLKQNPQVSALSVGQRYPDGRPQLPGGAFASIADELLSLSRIEKIWPDARKFFLGQHTWVDPKFPYFPDWIWGAFWLAHRSIIAGFEGGKLPEVYFMYYEDVLWGWLLQKEQGKKIMYTPVSTIIHHIAGSNKSGKSDEEKYREKIFHNEWMFLKKYRGELYARAYLLTKILHLLSLRQPEQRARASFYWNNLLS